MNQINGTSWKQDLPDPWDPPPLWAYLVAYAIMAISGVLILFVFAWLCGI